MIIYNVTINVEDEIAKQWLTWMKETHIPQVMNTGMFESFKILKIISTQEDETGQTYAVQYFASNMQHYNDYINIHADALRTDAIKMWGNKFIAFRTLLQELD